MSSRFSSILKSSIITKKLFNQKKFLSNTFSGIILPEIPEKGSCCGSGCQNCVWLVYAEDVLNAIKNHPDFKNKSDRKKVYNNIELLLANEIEDPNLREFILMDVRSKFN
uniref:Oxidoreductase-like domain-containing protein n=1 Tax=Strongyloides stercoralis TaxID=6248 RepID=A0A0K0E181_STRER